MYVGWDNQEHEDLEMENMLRDVAEERRERLRGPQSLDDIYAYALIVFDLDGVLVKPIVGDKRTGHFRAHAHDWKLLPGHYDAIRALHEQVQIAIATNQGSAAFNIMHPNDIKRAVDDAAYLLGIYLVYICFDHPKGTNPKWAHETYMRKPGPGMLQRAMFDANTEPERTLFVGDREEDAQAAHNAGCAFMRADQFFALLTGASPAVAAVPAEDYPF